MGSLNHPDGFDGQDSDDEPADSGPGIMAADTLEGNRVVARLGEELGTIDDLMIDAERAVVAYVVMSGAGKLGERFFAIPWHALELDLDRHCFILDVERASFDAAPGFDKDHWPSMADDRWAEEVHRFYGVPPYWQSGLGSATGAGRAL
jgi:hypothetical protein